MGIGSLAGSLTLAFMRRRRAIPLMLVGGMVFSLLLVGIAASRSVWLAAPLIMAAGYASMLMINTINATIQANVTDALRGRVMALYVTVFAGTAPLGGLFAGAVAEAWGTPAAFLAGAALSAATLVIVALGLRGARRRGTLGVTNSTARWSFASDGSRRRRDRCQRRAECVGSRTWSSSSAAATLARRSSGIGSSSS